MLRDLETYLRTSTRVRTLPRHRRRWSHARACPQARRSCRGTRESAAGKLCLVDARIRELRRTGPQAALRAVEAHGRTHRGPRLARADRHAYRRAARISAGGSAASQAVRELGYGA